jgi:uncharacterized protein (DUF2252 family)
MIYLWRFFCLAVLLFYSAVSLSVAEPLIKAARFSRLHDERIGGEVADRLRLIRDEIFRFNAFIKDADVRAAKFSAMSADRFAFFRATNHLYYRDLKKHLIEIPAFWAERSPEVWLSADFHAQNAGFYDRPERIDADETEIIFGLNDFDDSLPGPFYVDLLRFLSSIYLLCGLEDSPAGLNPDEAGRLFVDSYESALLQPSAQLNNSHSSGFVLKRLQKISDKKDQVDLLKKWTVNKKGKKPVFDFSSDRLEKLTETEEVDFQQVWNGFLQQKSTAPVGFFRVKSIARRLNSGLGSLGVQKIYVLVEGNSDKAKDDIILEVKEQPLPQPLFGATPEQLMEYYRKYGNPAELSLQAEEKLLGRPEPYSGQLHLWGAYFSVRRISPWKDGFEAGHFKDQSRLNSFVQHCAQALAYSHKRSNADFAPQAINFFAQIRPTKEMLKLSREYALQVTTDFELFRALLNN